MVHLLRPSLCAGCFTHSNLPGPSRDPIKVPIITLFSQTRNLRIRDGRKPALGPTASRRWAPDSNPCRFDLNVIYSPMLNHGILQTRRPRQRFSAQGRCGRRRVDRTYVFQITSYCFCGTHLGRFGLRLSSWCGSTDNRARSISGATGGQGGITRP